MEKCPFEALLRDPYVTGKELREIREIIDSLKCGADKKNPELVNALRAYMSQNEALSKRSVAVEALKRELRGAVAGPRQCQCEWCTYN